MSEKESIIKQKWFYEFNLPDGTKTESYLPEDVRKIHTTREQVLRHFLKNFEGGFASAIDVSCHEGFFSLILSEYFEVVTALDKNIKSLKRAIQITDFLGNSKINFVHSSVEDWNIEQTADFVLCYGLLYHVENPIQIMRKLAAITKKSLCIETQVMPFNISGSLEDGSYLWQREIQGNFAVCLDYSESPEGGLTDLSLIPSKQTLEFLLRQFGFNTIDFYKPNTNDYEQFTRGHRVIVFAEK